MAGDPTIIQLSWILVAAVGARGLAMGLNRIIDKDIDAANPRTAGRHLASGTMSMQTAWALCAVFLVMLLLGAGMLNPLCLYLSPIPVLAFVIYPYLKRFTWLCHWWLGVCLGLAPAGAWVAITGEIGSYSWYPDLLWVSIGVVLWIAAFDLGYAQMDIASDKENNIKSFPSRFSPPATLTVMLLSTPLWAFPRLLHLSLQRTARRPMATASIEFLPPTPPTARSPRSQPISMLCSTARGGRISLNIR